MNPAAIAKQNGHNVVQFFPIGDDFGLLPGVSLTWDFDPEKKEIGVRINLRVVKHSPIAGASRVAEIQIARPISITSGELKAAWRALETADIPKE